MLSCIHAKSTLRASGSVIESGVVLERWFHESGCRRWHTASRDTTTDAWLPVDD
ncbi:MAG: sarcosine oxidase subunit delta, partial [Ilumatobacteraceae bacterium]